MEPNTKTSLYQAQKLINYNFQRPELLEEALKLPGPGTVRDGNKRLALVGEASMISASIYSWYPSRSPKKTWDDHRQNILGNTNCAEAAKSTGLVFCRERNNSQTSFSNNQAATLLQAVVGAVYVDSNGNMDAVRSVMETLGIESAPKVADFVDSGRGSSPARS